MKVLCIGDVVGKSGRQILVDLLPSLRQEFDLDAIIANVENAAGGSGLTARIAKHFFYIGCDVLTLGDHVWDQKEIEKYLDTRSDVIRAANFPPEVPGCGWCVKELLSGKKIGVICLLGRVFMKYNLDCPFKTLEAVVERVKQETNIIIVDFHAETTSEKVAMGWHADGKVSAVVGTHTHIQTADEKILPQGTAYITDLGMTGPYDSIIGQIKENIVRRFLTSMPVKFQVAKEGSELHGVVIDIDEETGNAVDIIRVQRKKENANG